MEEIANRKSAELEAALWEASRQGQYPILCDQSPCLYRMRQTMRKMGLAEKMLSLARLCSETVIIPEETGCCGFAGDKGFTHPEINRYALRHLRRQIEHHGIKAGYSNSRTCEIGLSTHSGIAYRSIVT